ARKRPELIVRGERIGTSKLTDFDVRSLLNDRMTGLSFGKLAARYKIDKSTVQDICKGERWTHVLGKDGCPTLEQLSTIKGSRTPSAKLTADQVADIKGRLAAGETGRALGKAFGVHFATISDIKR